MFATFKRLIGNITVKTKNGVIYVEGVPGDVISKDIKRVWETNRINQYLFNHIDDSSFSLYEFFALELAYIIEKLLDDKKQKASVRTLTKIKEQLYENTWLKKTKEDIPSIVDLTELNQFNVEPFSYQLDFINYYGTVKPRYGLYGGLLAAAPGSGKTILSLMLMACLKKDQIIVVAPNNSIYRVWEATVRTIFKKEETYWVSKGNKPFTGKEKFIICHYEWQSNLFKNASLMKGKNIGIILDESHNFNEVSALRTEVFVALGKEVKSEDILWMSGTAIKALAKEAIPLMRSIDSLFTADVETRFKKIFGVNSQAALDIINNRLGILSFKVEKKETGVEKPEIIPIKVTVPDGAKYTLEKISKDMYIFTQERLEYYRSRFNEDKKIFDECLKNYQRTIKSKNDYDAFDKYQRDLKTVILSGGDVRIAKDEIVFCNRFEKTKIVPTLSPEMKHKFREVKSLVKYVRLKVQGECLGRIVGQARIQAHLALCEHLDYVSILESTAKKTVVFTNYVDIVEKLKEHLPKLGLEPLFVYAKTNAQMPKIVHEFETNENKNPLVATYPSLSTAVPLVMADTMILIDSPYRDYQLQQAISRINRVGATTKSRVYMASLDTGDKPNISTRTMDILKWSQTQTEAILGIKSPYEISDMGEAENIVATMEDFDEAPIAPEMPVKTPTFMDAGW